MRLKVFLVLILFLTAGPMFADSGLTIGFTMHITVTTNNSYDDHDKQDSPAFEAKTKSSDSFVWEATVTDTWPVTSSSDGMYMVQFGPATGMSTSLEGAGSKSFSVKASCITTPGNTVIEGQGNGIYELGAPQWPQEKYGQIVIAPFMGMYFIGPFFPDLWYRFTGKYHEVDTDCQGHSTTDDEAYDDTNGWQGQWGVTGDFAVDDWNTVTDDPDILTKLQMTGSFDPNTGTNVSQRASFAFDHSYTDDDGNGIATWTTKVDIVWTLTFGPTPLPPPSTKDDDCHCKEDGSIIGAQDQSLGEAVAIAGTPFALRYQSDREPGRLGDTAAWTARKLAMGGWSFDVHHAYDPTAGVLYLGSGERRSGGSVQPVPMSGGGFLIPSQDDHLIYQFDPAGNHFRTLDEFTGTALLEFAYDGQGRLTGIRDDSGNLTSIERNGDQPTAIVGPFGHRTTLSSDANGYLSNIQAPDGAATALTYDAKGLMSTLTDPRGNVHQFSFDSTGRLTQDTDPEGNSQTLTETGVDNGYAVQRTTTDGLTTVYTVVNPNANPTFQTQFPDGSVATGTKTGPFFGSGTGVTGMVTATTYGQDPRWGLQAALPASFSTTTPGGISGSGTLNRTVTLSDPSNPLSLSGLQDITQLNRRTYRTEFAASNRTLTDTSPAGRQVVTTLDAHGRTAALQKNGLAPFQFTYDSQGRLSTVTTGDADQQRTQKYEYETDGLLSRFTDALGQVTSFQRDQAGRVVSQTLPDKGGVAFGYDASGNMTSITPPGRPAHTFSFTPVDLLSFYIPPMLLDSGMPASFLWNPEKDLWQTTRADGGVVRRNFDAMGRVASIDLPTGGLSYTYDAKTGQTTQVADTDGNSLSYSYDGDLLVGNTWSGAVKGQVQSAYDSDFRPVSVAVNGGKPVAIGYDGDGYVVSAGDMTVNRDATTGLISGTSLDKVTDSLVYNVFGELTQYTASGPGGALMAVKYTRDKLGRITDKSETIGGVTSAWHYGYDAAGRLISVDENGAAVARYTYDANGNRTGVTASGTSEASTYDDQDRLTQRGTAPYQYAASGELASKTVTGQQTQYEYDALGNLRRVLLASGKEIRYVVDGENRRTGKKINGTLAKGFLYQNSLRPAAELDGAGNVVSLFVYGDREGAPLYLVKGGVKYEILVDHLGSPRLVVNTTTGAIAQRMDYDAFGGVTTDTNPGFQPFGLAGGLYDPDTGLVQFGARDYDAEAGRWTAKDPALFDGGDTNLYGYVGNDPVNQTDRAGTTWFRMEAAGAAVPVTPPPAAPKQPPKQPPPAPCKKTPLPNLPPVFKWGKQGSSTVKILTVPGR